MTDWIKHKPGDPMPVDGDCLVEVKFGDGTKKEGPAPASSWPTCWQKYGPEPRYEITAYRIHKKEREMKYKAGDSLHIKLNEYTAERMNESYLEENGHNWKKHGTIKTLWGCPIISHEPAPEPVVGYFNVYPDGAIIQHKDAEGAKRNCMDGLIAHVRLTVFPATKEVKAEIVE